MSDVPEKYAQKGIPMRETNALHGVIPEATQFVYRNAGNMVRLAAIPYFVLVVITVLLDKWEKIPTPDHVDWLWFLVLVVVFFTVSVMFAAAWHRHTISSSRAGFPSHGLKWGNGEWRFLAYNVSFYVLCFFQAGIAIALSAGVPGLAFIFVIALGVCILVIFSRVCLVFPAASIEADFGLQESLTLTKGKTWEIAGYWLLLLLLWWVATWPITLVIWGLIEFLGEAGFVALVVESVLTTALSIVGMCIGVSLLSFIFLRLAIDESREDAPSYPST